MSSWAKIMGGSVVAGVAISGGVNSSGILESLLEV